MAKAHKTYKYLPPKMADNLQNLGISVRKQMDGGMRLFQRAEVAQPAAGEPRCLSGG